MRRFTIGITTYLSCIVALVLARQDGTPPVSTFRGGIDLVELDVSALDKDRHPVQGLTESDFTVTIDGQPRNIVAFKAVDLPAPPPPAAASWIRDVAPDVATNIYPSGRVVAIVIDDGSFAGMAGDTSAVYAIQKTRAVAKAAVDALGPDDLAAVVFTENNHTAQDFTTDRRRLMAAIDTAALVPTKNDLSTSGACYCGLCSIEALQNVAQSLRLLPQQRKVALYVSLGVAVATPEMALTAPSGTRADRDICNASQITAMEHVFQEAELSNVTIEAVDLEGLSVGDGPAASASMTAPPPRTIVTNPFGTTNQKIRFLQTMAGETGGRAVVNNNDMEREVPALLDESRSYYLIGVERPLSKDDGRMHPIKVKVDRPDVQIRSRDGYYAPTAKEKKALATDPLHGVDASVADPVAKPDFPLAVAVAPFAAAGGGAELAIALNVSQPNASTSAHQEPVILIIRTINPETGNVLGTSRENVNLVWNASSATAGQYEVFSRMPIQPGRYELRIGVQTGELNTASVYSYAEVPKFSDEPLSLSGLVVSATPSPMSAPKDAFAGLLPVVPTARRVFHRSDHVNAFLRIYQGGSHPLSPVTIRTHIVDANNEPVDETSKELDPVQFSTTRSFDYNLELPLALVTGDCLLTVDVTAGAKTVQRTLRFQVQD